MSDEDPLHERRFLTRREAELLLAAGARAQEERFVSHQHEHAQQDQVLQTALAVVQSRQEAHNLAHDREHQAHGGTHDAENKAIETALNAVGRERIIHAEAHEREHTGHLDVHRLNNLAIDKAEASNDKRFEATNAFREQLNDLINQLASKETVAVRAKEVDRRIEEMRKDTERRYEEFRQAITALERFDVRAEGRGIGSRESRAGLYALLGATVTVVLAITSLIVFFNGLA